MSTQRAKAQFLLSDNEDVYEITCLEIPAGTVYYAISESVWADTGATLKAESVGATSPRGSTFSRRPTSLLALSDIEQKRLFCVKPLNKI